MTTTAIPSHIEENLHYIELVTRKKIRNILVGNYSSALKGHGYDFIDHKVYQPGDDIRKIDWSATARSSHPLVKNTHEERDLEVMIVADWSNSMNVVTARYSKQELLLYITTALAHSALSDDMRVGCVGFTDREEFEIKPTRGKAHLWEMVHRLWDFKPQGSATRVLPVLEGLDRRLTKMTIVFLVSDFVFDEDIFQSLSFKRLVSRHDVVPILLKDPSEAQLPEGRGYMWVRDLESGKERCVRLSPEHRIRYAEAVERRHKELVDRFYENGLDFIEVRTDQEFHELLLSLFLTRKRR